MSGDGTTFDAERAALIAMLVGGYVLQVAAASGASCADLDGALHLLSLFAGEDGTCAHHDVHEAARHWARTHHEEMGAALRATQAGGAA